MNCTQFERLLPVYLDGSEEGHMIAGLESHALTCPECGRLLAAHRLVLTGLSAAVPEQAPPGFEERLHAAIETAGPARSPNQYAFAFQVAALLAIIFGVTGLIIYTLLGDIAAEVSGYVASVSSWFRIEMYPWGIPDGIKFAEVWMMEYANQAGTVYAALFVPVAIPSTSLSIAPIYLISAVIMVILLGWYLNSVETGTAVRVRRK